MISGDSQIARPVKASCFLPGGSSEPLQDPFKSVRMRQACMVANRAQREQQVILAYSIIVGTTSPAHPQGCFSSLLEIQTVLACLHILQSTDPKTSHSSPMPQPENQGQKAAPCDPNLHFIKKHDKTLMKTLQNYVVEVIKFSFFFFFFLFHKHLTILSP